MTQKKNGLLTPAGFLLFAAVAFGGGFSLCYWLLQASSQTVDVAPTPMEAPTDPEPAVTLTLRPQARTSRIPVIMYHDITPDKKVFFDVTPKKFRAHLESIRANGSTPITLDQLEAYLTQGEPLPPKPILLTFDDGYEGHFTEVYPLLKEFNYPAVFYVHTAFVGSTAGRPHMTWAQLQQLASEDLVTIASHTVNHPADMNSLDPEQLRRELADAKQILEEKLGKPVVHLAYPAGIRNETVVAMAQELGYHTATTMDEGYVGTSAGLLELNRFGQSQLAEALAGSSGEADPDLAISALTADFTKPLSYVQVTVNKVQLSMALGGRPYTVHGDRRYNLKDYVLEVPTGAAAVTGGFFPLRGRDTSKMIGPVLAQNEEQLLAPPLAETGGLSGRPLVMIGAEKIVIAPFNRGYLMQETGIRSLLPDVRDVFLGGTWLVRNGLPQGREQMLKVNLASYLEVRHRSFIGVYGDGRFVAGITHNRNSAPKLAEALAAAGIQEAVLMDSGASTDLVYRGQSLVSYEPRPVPHAIVVQAEINPAAPPPRLPLAQGRP
ncbi:polysaccharide deacetylase family protein [Candidatus Cyanaurora vandensis]|uniref:polysaccharide deacetylase family protein n=1 Tax=Candidatus Cyanaurora vandensis TaxID=2714958 RepID=UPI00257ECF7B|nr:polysaccharide deacetylase family protein [Candidatus Cyanaurora vandensis]